MNEPFKIVAPLDLNNKESTYYITRSGEVYNKDTGKEIKQRFNNSGYKVIDLYQDHIKKTYLVHRLTASRYIDNPDNKPTVNHINGDKTDNNVDNLEWMTYQENNKHAIDNKLHIPLYGEDCLLSKYSVDDVKSICIELEKGLQPLEVSNKLDLPVSLVRAIKSRNSWVNISDQYDIPNTRFYMPEDIRTKIKNLYNSGLTITEICIELGWEPNSIHSKRIKRAICR